MRCERNKAARTYNVNVLCRTKLNGTLSLGGNWAYINIVLLMDKFFYLYSWSCTSKEKYGGHIRATWWVLLQMAPEKKKKNLIRMEQGLLLWSLHFTRQRTNTPFPLKNEMARAGPTASKAPVSPNVKLIYPLIKWKTIEMSARVIQPRRIANMATEQAFLSSFTKSGAVFRNDIMDDYVYIRETGFHFIIGYLSSSFVDVVFSSTVQCFCFVFET